MVQLSSAKAQESKQNCCKQPKKASSSSRLTEKKKSKNTKARDLKQKTHYKNEINWLKKSIAHTESKSQKLRSKPQQQNPQKKYSLKRE